MSCCMYKLGLPTLTCTVVQTKECHIHSIGDDILMLLFYWRGIGSCIITTFCSANHSLSYRLGPQIAAISQRRRCCRYATSPFVTLVDLFRITGHRKSAPLYIREFVQCVKFFMPSHSFPLCVLHPLVLLQEKRHLSENFWQKPTALIRHSSLQHCLQRESEDTSPMNDRDHWPSLLANAANTWWRACILLKSWHECMQ